MRILQIASQVPVPATDGGKLSTWGLTTYLNKLGHSIDFVCYLKHNDFEESYNLLKEHTTPYLIEVKTDNNIWKAFLNMFSPIPYNASKYIKPELKKVVLELLKNNNYDIIQIEHLHMGWIVDEIKKHTNTPVILRQQNLELFIMKRFYQQEKNILLKMYAKLQYNKFLKFEPLICSKFDKVIMISKKDEENLKKLNPLIKTQSIPAGIDTELLNVVRKKEIPYSLVHIGSLNWYPNLDGLRWFIESVFPKIVKKFPDTILFIYGGGNPSQLKLSKEIERNIKFIGFVDNLWDEISDKSLAIVPLRIGGGIRIKILEMLAVGQIILTTSIGKEGIEIVDEKNGLIADSEEEFIEKIADFFNNKFNLNKIRNEGKKLIKENYTWEKIALRFENEYRKLINVH